MLPRLTPTSANLVDEGELENVKVSLKWSIDEESLQKMEEKAKKNAEKKQEVRFG